MRRSSTDARARSLSKTFSSVVDSPPRYSDEKMACDSPGTQARMPIASSAPRASEASMLVANVATVTMGSWRSMTPSLPCHLGTAERKAAR